MTTMCLILDSAGKCADSLMGVSQSTAPRQSVQWSVDLLVCGNLPTTCDFANEFIRIFGLVMRKGTSLLLREVNTQCLTTFA